MRVFGAATWRFHQLGVLSTAEPFAPIPTGEGSGAPFYDLVVATPSSMNARPFALLGELQVRSPMLFHDLPPPRAFHCLRCPSLTSFALLEELQRECVDALPEVLVIDVPSDAALQRRMEEARALLRPLDEAARAATLGLLVSSWTGGHLWQDGPAGGVDEHKGRALSESLAWRREHRTNVRPIGSVHVGGDRVRALLFKCLFDSVIAPLAREQGSSQGSACRLHRARDGRYECMLHAVADEGRASQGGATDARSRSSHAAGVLVELYCGGRS